MVDAGRIADKVLHGLANDLFLVRATEQGTTDGETPLTKVVVLLDDSPLAEKVLPRIGGAWEKMPFEVILMRAYALPPAISPMSIRDTGKSCLISWEPKRKIIWREKPRSSQKRD